MKQTPVEYKGIVMRSRLVAQWAVFFDALNIKWEYQDKPITTPQSHYGPSIPDFYLPAHRYWVKVCATPVEMKEHHNLEELMWEFGGLSVRILGEPWYHEWNTRDATMYTETDSSAGDCSGFWWSICNHCGGAVLLTDDDECVLCGRQASYPNITPALENAFKRAIAIR